MAEGARLESVYMGNCIEGSNPSLSAKNLRPGYRPEAYKFIFIALVFNRLFSLSRTVVNFEIGMADDIPVVYI